MEERNMAWPAIFVNVALLILELIALEHDIQAFGVKMFKWYTIDSNLLQLAVSVLLAYHLLKDKHIPDYLTRLHFISAVALTVTFLIVAMVLAPHGRFKYYFVNNVAPINHLFAPILSVSSLLFLEKAKEQGVRIILYPAATTLFYGLICLILNAVGKLKGPYFFLEAGSQPVYVILLWFGIIAVLCMSIAFIYYKIKWRQKIFEVDKNIGHSPVSN